MYLFPCVRLHVLAFHNANKFYVNRKQATAFNIFVFLSLPLVSFWLGLGCFFSIAAAAVFLQYLIEVCFTFNIIEIFFFY